MFGSSTSFGVMQPSAAQFDTNDEEIAFQLQLEAITESTLHHHSRPKVQQSSSSQDGASSSGNRPVHKFRNPGQYSGAPVPTLAMNDSTDWMLSFALQKLRETVERDGPNDGASGSASVGRGPVLETECVICTEMRPYTSFISTTGCTHVYCVVCVQHYAEGKITSGSSEIQCPHEDCEHSFDIQQCKEVLSPASFEILTTRQTEAAIPSSLKVYCPFKDCSAFMEKSSGRGSRFVECWACHRGFCVKCNTPWHANMTCREFRADVENANRAGDEKLRDLAEKEKWQTCADCKRVIELKEGCFHMTCLCGNEFCYICGAKWKNKVATCNCKLWDESNIIRTRPRRFRAVAGRAPWA